MNRKELLARIGRQLNKADTLDSRTEARLLDYINSRHRILMSAPGLAGLRRRQIRFTVNPGVARYAFLNGENVKHLRDLANDQELAQRSLGTYRQYNPDPATQQGTPTGYVQYGFEPVQWQPGDVSTAESSPLFVKSTSPADTTQIVHLASYYALSDTTLNGTTPVAVPGLWSYIERFYLSAPAVGLVTLHANSGTGPQVSSLGGQTTSAQWLAIYLDPTPSAALTYDVDMEFLINDLVGDTAEPQLPNDFHDLLELGVILDELHHLDDSRLVVWQRRYEQRLGQLQLKLARMGTDQAPRGVTSRYGPYAPATRW